MDTDIKFAPTSVMDFAAGMVVKMNVGSRSHVTQPYYVLITFYDEKANMKGQLKMITTIPEQHSCRMIIGENWEYHLERMELMGDMASFGHLLYNQKNLWHP